MKIYVLNSNIEEIILKGYVQITDEEFKLFGEEITIEELQHDLNTPCNNSKYNHFRDHIRFIKDDNDQ